MRVAVHIYGALSLLATTMAAGGVRALLYRGQQQSIFT